MERGGNGPVGEVAVAMEGGRRENLFCSIIPPHTPLHSSSNPSLTLSLFYIIVLSKSKSSLFLSLLFLENHCLFPPKKGMNQYVYTPD